VRSFWPVGEGAQRDYECLRAAVLAGTPLVGAPAARFAASGLAGLILRPGAASAVFDGVLRGAPRPPWSPYTDPRFEALAEGYLLVLGAAESSAGQSAAAAAVAPN
jgi:hypothetical protein